MTTMTTRYRHTPGCSYIGTHPERKATGADGVPRVLMLDRTTGGTVLEPCACWAASHPKEG